MLTIGNQDAVNGDPQAGSPGKTLTLTFSQKERGLGDRHFRIASDP
jgi:hypothetical protein